ncbi:hypothetical protein [Oricola indica]|uniref:hypothetical protein n=1 Tax=Oricola indica TaxID=2872591 RepID=UPI003CCC0BB3
MSSLDYSNTLNVYKWSDHTEVNNFIGSVYENYFNSGNPGIQKKHIKVVLLHLYVTWLDDPDLKTAYSRNVNDYKAGSRYNALHISKKIIEIIDRLIEVGLVNHALGFIDHETGVSRLSRMWPTNDLIKMFQDAKFGPFDVTDAPGRETIILRDVDSETGKKEEIEYEDTPDTLRMREMVEAYNDLLSRTFIDVPTLEMNRIELGQDTNGNQKFIHVNQRDKFTRRIFNRGSFDKGGRFFGGWWQRCPKEVRHQIFLNDHPITEIDYSGLHIVILYANQGINYWKEHKSDPYDLSKPNSITNTFSPRDLCKQLLLVALNAKDDNSTFQAFRDEAETGSPEKHLTNNDLAEVLDALREKHDPISNMIANDAGIDLMHQDSRIAELVIQHFTEKGIPILCIHDSFLVPFGLEDELHQTMTNAFSKITGTDGVQLKQDTYDPRDDEPLDGNSAEHFSYQALELALEAVTNPPRSERYQRDMNQFSGWLWDNGKEPCDFAQAVKDASSPVPRIFRDTLLASELDEIELLYSSQKSGGNKNS